MGATTLMELLMKVDTSQLQKAQEELKKVNAAAKDAAGGAAEGEAGFKGLSAGLGIAIAAGTLFIGVAAKAYNELSELRMKSIEAADKMNDLANRTNIATDRLSLLDYAAKNAGSNVEELVGSSERLASKLAKQDENTGRAVTALKVLGVSTKDASGNLKSMLQLQEDIVAASVNAADAAKAEGAAIQLLGTDFYKLRNVIKEAKDSKSELYDYMQKTNALISGPLAKNSDAYKDNVARLGSAFTGIGNSIAEATLPGMIRFQEKMIQIAEYAADVIRRFAGLTTGAEETGAALAKLVMERNNAAASIKRIEGTEYENTAQGSKALADAREKVTVINDQIREMQRLKSGADAAAASVKSAVTDGNKNEGAKVTGKATKPDDGDFKGDAAYREAMRQAQERMRTRYKEEDEITKTLTASKIASLEADHKLLVSENAKVASAEQSLAEYRIQVDVLQKYGATTDDVRIAIDNYNISQAESALQAAVNAKADDAEIARLQLKLDTLVKLRDVDTDRKGVNDTEIKRQESFSSGWEKAFKDYEKSANDASKTAGDVFGSVTSNMSSALTTFVTTGKLDFKSFTASILADLAKIAAEKLVAGIVGSLFGGSTSSGASYTSGSFSAASTYANGGAFTNGVQFYASGDVFGSPTAFNAGSGKLGVLGEAGPEAIMPLTRGANGKLGVAAAGGGSVINNNLTVNVGSVDSKERQDEMLRSIQSAMELTARKVISDEKRNGGQLASVR